MLYLCFWLPFSTVPDASLVPSYTAALSMFAFSAWLESFAEPYVILSLRFGLDGQYAFAQGFLVITQRVFVVILIITIPILPVHAFCFAQVCLRSRKLIDNDVKISNLNESEKHEVTMRKLQKKRRGSPNMRMKFKFHRANSSVLFDSILSICQLFFSTLSIHFNGKSFVTKA